MWMSWPGSRVVIWCHTPWGTTMASPAPRSTCGVAVGELEGHRDRAGDQVEQLVAVGVHLAVVGWVAGDLRCADREPVDALGWPAGDLVHEPRPPVGTIEADHLARQVDPSTWLYLLRRGHVVSSVRVACSPVGGLFPDRPREFANRDRCCGEQPDDDPAGCDCDQGVDVRPRPRSP